MGPFKSATATLAGFLAAHPGLPVLMPGLPAKITVHALQGGDAGNRGFAGVAAVPSTPITGHYGTWRAFGPVSFSALAISAAHMAAHAAQMSRHGHVTPGAGSVPDAPAA